MISYHKIIIATIKILRAGSELKILIINQRDRVITARKAYFRQMPIESFKKLGNP
jgi:hypothetical protein